MLLFITLLMIIVACRPMFNVINIRVRWKNKCFFYFFFVLQDFCFILLFQIKNDEYNNNKLYGILYINDKAYCYQYYYYAGPVDLHSLSRRGNLNYKMTAPFV